MISPFDADDAFADDSAMGYQHYTADFKLSFLKRYFTPPMKPVRDLAAELGVPFSTLAEWVTKARKAGMLNPGEPLPAMVEVGAALHPRGGTDRPDPGDGDDFYRKGDGDAAGIDARRSAGGAAQAMIDLDGKRVMVYPGPTDFRYGINGLSLLVGQREEGVVYAFCGKSGKSLKFLESGTGAEASATMMTVVRTALRNGLIPERYLA